MTALFITAFVTGLFGSLHCAGMCGPLALSFNMQGRGNPGWHALMYNVARIAAYAMLGVLFGAIGLTFGYAGWQQAASFVMGAMILIVLGISWLGYTAKLQVPWLQRYTHMIRTHIAKAFSAKNAGQVLALGFFNGLLPCGLVYLALAGAVASGGIGSGALYMAFFGLGTLPLMFSFAAFGSYLGLKQRFYIRKYLPAFSFVVAVLLILRGLNLGIPYVSPSFDAQAQVNAAGHHQVCAPGQDVTVPAE